jgi:hypothetical protein
MLESKTAADMSLAATSESPEASAKIQTEGLKGCAAAAILRTEQSYPIIGGQNQSTLSCDVK